MDRAAVFVDAGYLFAAGSQLLSSERLTRGRLHIDNDRVLQLFSELTRELTGLPLLRIYWYDGTASGPTPQHLALAYRPSIKLRLGFVNQHGQQKGVDSLVVTDLINLSRNRAMADALVLTGDEDIRVGVEQAQEYGVRVHLLGIAPARENQSSFLVQEADTVRELSASEVRSFLSVTPEAERSALGPDGGAALMPSEELTRVARTIARDLDPEEWEAVLLEAAAGSVPGHIDRRLLVAASSALGSVTLDPGDKRTLRAAFVAACQAIQAESRARQSP